MPRAVIVKPAPAVSTPTTVLAAMIASMIARTSNCQ